MNIRDWIINEELRLYNESYAYGKALSKSKLAAVRQLSKTIDKPPCLFTGSLWDDCEIYKPTIFSFSHRWGSHVS